MPQISQVLDHRLQNVTIHTSQTTVNRAGEWVSHHIADAPDLMAVAWDVWDNAKADTESALAAAFEQAKEWLQGRPLTPDLEDGFYAAFDQHLLDVEFDNWAVINRVDTNWFTQEDYSNWEQSGAGPEGLTECLPDLHLGRPYESGPEGPATHIRAYAFPELPVGALLTYLAANRRVDLPPPPQLDRTRLRRRLPHRPRTAGRSGPDYRQRHQSGSGRTNLGRPLQPHRRRLRRVPRRHRQQPHRPTDPAG